MVTRVSRVSSAGILLNSHPLTISRIRVVTCIHCRYSGAFENHLGVEISSSFLSKSDDPPFKCRYSNELLRLSFW